MKLLGLLYITKTINSNLAAILKTLILMKGDGL